MCRPLHVSSRGPFTGGHIGPPLHNAGSVPEPTRIGVKRTLRGEAEPVPYRCITGRAQRTGRCGHRPLRRRSRLAVRRMAGAREETGERHAGDRRALRGKVQEGMPLPGFRRLRRKESKSFFAAACTWRKILLRPQVWKMAAPMGRPFYARSRPALSFAQGSFAALGEEISR